MSVIWSGITEEGAVVPVQVTEEGKVVAVGDGPEGDYVKKTGDNMTGDLTLGTDEITLNATGGSTTFKKSVNVGNGRDISNNTDATGIRLAQDSAAAGVYTQCKGSTIASAQVAFMAHHGSSKNFEVKYDGSAEFSGAVRSERLNVYSDNVVLAGYNPSNTRIIVIDSEGTVQIGGNLEGVIPNNQPKIWLNPNGSATFAGGICGFTSGGELFFTSRGTRYKLVVAGELCTAEPYTREMELKEKKDQFIADQRETKPAQPGISPDIDNSSLNQD